MNPWFVAFVVSLACLTPGLSHGQAGASRPLTDAELRSHLDATARRVDDGSIDVGVRARLALEMASTLDRAAASSPSPETRRARWSEAAHVLDRFTERNPGHSREQEFQVQGAVYLWACARTWIQALKVNPADAKARENARNDLDECVKRLKPFYDSLGAATDVLAQNCRFRMAQSLADLAEVGPEEPTARRYQNNAALQALAITFTEPSLNGFAHLLRALILARLNRFTEAQSEISLATASNPAPPESETVEAKLAVLSGQKNAAAALKVVDDSKLDAGTKAVLRIRVRLEERVMLSEAPQRLANEIALFGDLKSLRVTNRPEARASLMAVAGAIAEPGADQPPESWDLLSEGALALGEPSRAGELERKAADRAEALNRPADAVTYRLRAGAYLYQAERFADADPILTQVVDDPKGGASRPRAGLLLALARGRALSLNRPGATEEDYATALRNQIKNFPDDVSASEARWLLGKLREAKSDREGALTLWKAIPHGSPRWLESRVEIASEQRDDIESQRLNNDREALDRKLGDARSFLSKSLEQARGEVETNEILLATARLELTPVIGRPEVTQKLMEQLQRSAALPAQRDAARRLQIAAFAQQGRWIEAEQAARREARISNPVDLIPLIRILDRSAADAESDLRTRRLGFLISLIMTRQLESFETLPKELREEIRLKHIRALLFSGDGAAARKAIAGLAFTPPTSGPDLLRDLAETYVRLEAYELAVDVQRLRSKLATTGTLAWFDARYGLALAYYRSGKPKDALHLIDATAILHPDLGGGELHDRFIRLRQKIDPTD